MTLNFMRPAIALAIALTLAGCGGKASFPITGTVFNLQYPGLVLSTNGMRLAVNPPATTFTFPNSLSYGEEFDVVIAGVADQPLHQTCQTLAPFIDSTTGRAYSSAKDTAGRTSSINIAVSCVLNAFTIGGSITGLTSDGLVLTNGSTGGTVAPLTGAATFAFGAAVAYNTSYGVTVLTQPANNVCSVTNGTGIMGDAAITNIAVTCVPKT